MRYLFGLTSRSRATPSYFTYACSKESNQGKEHPLAAYFLRCFEKLGAAELAKISQLFKSSQARQQGGLTSKPFK